MSYTRHNWIDPETINAAKMNNIEDGIEEAAQSGGGGGFAVVEMSATGYGSATQLYARVVYARQVNNNWVVINDEPTDWFGINGFGNRLNNSMLPPSEALISSTVHPFLVDIRADTLNVTGDISDTAEPIYYSYGSVVVGGGYRISGSGSIQFVAL